MDALYCNCHVTLLLLLLFVLLLLLLILLLLENSDKNRGAKWNNFTGSPIKVSIINKRTEIPLIGGGGYVDTLNKVIRFPLYLGYTSIVHLRISQYTDRRDEIERKL